HGDGQNVIIRSDSSPGSVRWPGQPPGFVLPTEAGVVKGTPATSFTLRFIWGALMRIAMIGSGYVGLVSGACLADFGHNVVCVDKDAERISALNRGDVPIFEPGLHDLIASNVRQGHLAFASQLAPAVAAAEAIFIAVGTPSRRGDGHADLSYVYTS